MLAIVPMRCMSIGGRIGDFGVALHEDADLALVAHRLLRGRDRLRAAERDRQHQAGKQHGVAHRHDDQRVGRQRRQASQPRFRASLFAQHFDCQPRMVPAFCNVITSQPSATARLHAAVAAGRQPQPPIEAALRQFEPVDGRGAQFARIGRACRR